MRHFLVEEMKWVKNWFHNGFKIVIISFIMGVKSILLDEKFGICLLLAPMIEKYEEID